MIEVLSPNLDASHTKVVLFDFDGTLSLIRSGWMGVMVPMMVEILAACKSGESEDELRAVVEDYVWRLTGQETVYQMITLADEVRKRGGNPLDPLRYKHIYLDRLWIRIRGRVEALRAGAAAPDDYMVPGTRRLLESLRNRGMTMYVASGTDEPFVQAEAELLDVARYFGPRWSTSRWTLRRLDEWLRRRLRCMKYKRFSYHDNHRMRLKQFERLGLLSLESFCQA